MNMLSNPALREIQPGRTAPPWMAPWRGDAIAASEPFCAGISAADRILRQTRQVALGRHRSTRTHVHNARCAYVLFHRSSVRMRTDSGDEEIATPLHVSLHAPGEIHAREALNEEGDDCDFIAVAPELLQRLRMCRAGGRAADESLFPSGPCETTPEIFLARRRLFSAASRQYATLNSRQIDAAVERLLALVVERASARHRFMQGQVRANRGRRMQLVEDAKTIVAREYQTDLTAMGLARRLHCSTAYLSRTFHAATGFRLVDYRHELRLRRAAYLIEQANAEIGEIAVRVGFASHSHFSSAFHRRFGITPSAYLNPAA
ncbi:MAG: helix-turn-helix transcriptional regulator [Proteobacteria bacterium]|nr:helix-turn-helix transcriptional regulator [Pseudomonadota bacterium]